MGASSKDFGADVTARQAVGLCVALCLGTVIEWYDFTIYSQLSSTLTAVFFPKSNPATAQLAFWGVYAVGFIARPLGAIVFGHIGDSLGRRVTLLISILAITLPTTIIGALPTYAQAGIIAPVLLAILRFIQGVAVGGEFGSAIVYLYEMAPRHRRGLLASLGQVAVSPGIILGIGACLAVLYGCSPDQLLVWGWRVPFLVTVVTAPLSLILRMHMPEPYEFLHSKQEMVLHRVASTAAAKVAKSFTQKHTRTSSNARLPSSRQISMQLLSMTRITLEHGGSATGHRTRSATGVAVDGDANGSADQVTDQQGVSAEDHHLCGTRQNGNAAAATNGCNHESHDAANGHSTVESGVGDVTGQTQQKDVSRTPVSPTHQRAGGFRSLRDMKAQELAVQSEVKLLYNHQHNLDDLGCEAEYEQQCAELLKQIKHHMPIVVLLKGHWMGLWLQFFLEGIYGAMFYTFFSWLPPYLHTSAGVTTELTLWAVMIGMALFAITVTVGGYFTDKGIPKVWVYMGLTLINAAVCIPVMYTLHTGSLVALMTLLPTMLGLCGCMGGLMTSIGPQIYPAGVRATGYNLGHNMAMSIWGGLTPFMVSALGLVMQPAPLAAGVLIVIVGVVSWTSAIPLMRIAPQTNATEGCKCLADSGSEVDGKAGSRTQSATELQV